LATGRDDDIADDIIYKFIVYRTPIRHGIVYIRRSVDNALQKIIFNKINYGQSIQGNCYAPRLRESSLSAGHSYIGIGLLHGHSFYYRYIIVGYRA